MAQIHAGSLELLGGGDFCHGHRQKERELPALISKLKDKREAGV